MAECPVVQIACGNIEGRSCLRAKPKRSKQVFRYAGIPYAKPPTRELRFERPQRCSSWNGVLAAVEMPPCPMQNADAGKATDHLLTTVNQFDEPFSKLDEDCLHVTVYTTNPSKTANMPVLYWIFGGGFQTGGASGYDAQALCGLHDVVVVVPNYRVNIFGFFTMGRETAYPGNMGLWDQVMALQWTRDNIREFGGDPENVTIFGESAGAVSVGLHLFSPVSRGLFHRAMQHSGAANLQYIVRKEYTGALKAYLKALHITATNQTDIIAHLKRLPAQEIIEKTKSLGPKLDIFAVVVDGDFVIEHPSKLLQQGHTTPVPSIIGCNSTEGACLLRTTRPKIFFSSSTEKAWFEKAKVFMLDNMQYKLEKVDQALETVKSIYEKDFSDNDPLKWERMASAFVSDPLFLVPSISQALLHSGNGHPTYFYFMKHRMKCYYDDDFSMEMKKRDEFCECDHSDDIYFTFGVPLMQGNKSRECRFSEDEENLSVIWMKYIANFALTGDPNMGEKVDHEWPKYEPHGRLHLSVDVPIKEDDHLIEERYKMWKKTLPAL
ncbi:unnamed protein product [Clavelina lepadiformis]|uniref:Carboxylic ester hydrolase n=1 Tax=Clavelina lepadiformis TaxID=159417 RepID=A0ABP0H0I5_CLALP